MRHGQAQPQGGFRSNDADRALTVEGRAKLTSVISLAKNSFHAEIDRILSSPYKRTLESADAAKEILKPTKPKIVTGEELEPQSSPYELYSFVSKQRFVAQDRVLIVSHQPILGDTISDLLGSAIQPSFPPASMTRIDIDDEPRAGSGKLVWLLSSDVI